MGVTPVRHHNLGTNGGRSNRLPAGEVKTLSSSHLGLFSP